MSITTAVFSYWNTKGISNTSGFRSFKDYLNSQTLAISQAKKNIGKVKVITNDFGAKIFEEINLISLIDELDTSLNQYDNLDPYFWGFTKIHAFEQQKEPFIHIDNDFFIWDYHDKLKHCDFGFQSPEIFDDNIYSLYSTLIDIMENAEFKPQTILENPDNKGLNCGIVACKNRFDIIEEWKDLAYNYITKNKDHFYNYKPEFLIHLNLLHEQYFIASLLKRNKISDNKIFYYFYNNFTDASKSGNRFSHLWGTVKKQESTMTKVENRVKIEQKEIASLIQKKFA
jgi:hypothetical protein